MAVNAVQDPVSNDQKKPSQVTSPLLSPSDTGAYLGGIAPQTLAKWRCTPGADSPPFVKISSRVYYRREQLDKWIAARERKATSDRGRAA